PGLRGTTMPKPSSFRSLRRLGLSTAAILLVSATLAAAESDPAFELLGRADPAAEGPTRGDRVVGGIEAPEGAYPFYLQLRRYAGDGRFGLCGAAAIAPRWLLTAAHCVQDRDKKTGRASSVRPARSFRALPEEVVLRNGPGFEVKRIVPHPRYSADYALQNDVALVEIAAPLEPPYLPLADSEPRPGEAVRIVGYGRTSFEGKSSRRLREANTRIVSRRDCSVVSRKLRGSGPIDGRRICADVEGRNGPVDSCQGDSGGPLLQADRSGLWRAVGIVSYGYKCAEPGFPGVYANVAAYRDWIESVIDRPKPVQTAPPKPTVSASKPPAPKPPAAPAPAASEPQPTTASTPPRPQGPPPAATPTAIQQIAALVDEGGVEMGVLTVGGGAAKAGDEVGFTVRSGLAGELYVFDIGRDGDARQIFPNDRTRKGRVKAAIAEGRERRLPAARDGFRLRAQSRAGDRWIVAIVVRNETDGEGRRAAERMSEVASTRGLAPIPDAGDYLREIVAAVAEPCAKREVRCAAGAVRLRIEDPS
ncbi:MAG: trypsin-like serine protease, partial [Pseudomonadota bacterium]